MTLDGHVVDSSQMTNAELSAAIISLREEYISNTNEEERYEISNAIMELSYEQALRVRDASKFDELNEDDYDEEEELDDDEFPPTYDDPDEDPNEGGEPIPTHPGHLS